MAEAGRTRMEASLKARKRGKSCGVRGSNVGQSAKGWERNV